MALAQHFELCGLKLLGKSLFSGGKSHWLFMGLKLRTKLFLPSHFRRLNHLRGFPLKLTILVSAAHSSSRNSAGGEDKYLDDPGWGI